MSENTPQKQSLHSADSDLHKTRRSVTWFNTVAAALMLLITLPCFIVIPWLIKRQDGGAVFYSGSRMGKNKRSFTIYKFRTLTSDAEARLGAQLVSTSQQQLELPIGKFLRDTRLDELPQLFNVLKGDMNIIGPRPERAAVYEAHCRQISGYDKRFAVRPGLIGYSQLFTPHGASKKTRTLIDNAFLQRTPHRFGELVLLIYALSVLALRFAYKGWRTIKKKIRRNSRTKTFAELRQAVRVRHPETYIMIFDDILAEQAATDEHHHGSIISGDVINMGVKDIYIIVSEPLPEHRLRIEMLTRYRSFGHWKPRFKNMHCHACLKIQRFPELQAKGEYHYILSMEDITPLNHLKLHKYFLYNSIC